MENLRLGLRFSKQQSDYNLMHSVTRDTSQTEGVQWKKIENWSKSRLKVEDVQWTNQFDLELDYDLKSSIDQDENLGHSKA